ncbi:MAG: DUF908 domain-containing protein [Bacilli bacterium]|nr:DUF908 domain-containing protein [Bacilli bacterium]
MGKFWTDVVAPAELLNVVRISKSRSKKFKEGKRMYVINRLLIITGIPLIHDEQMEAVIIDEKTLRNWNNCGMS